MLWYEDQQKAGTNAERGILRVVPCTPRYDQYAPDVSDGRRWHGRSTAQHTKRRNGVLTSSKRTLQSIVLLEPLRVPPDQEEHVDLSETRAEAVRGDGKVD